MALKIENVLISEPVDPVCGDILRSKGINVTVKTGLTKDQLLDEIKKYDALVVRSATKVTSDVIEAAENLRLIGRAGTGVDNIDCNAATQKGILVLNAPGGNTLSAAELTCGMVVTLSRHIPQACSSLKGGKWDRKSFMGHELNGKTLAIIGLGRIGREVAFRMQAFGMKTIGFDPLVPPEVSQEFGVQSYDLETIWPLADYITVHTPLIPQTKGLINDDVFSKCKKGVKIVNCARGGIVDEDALLRALESGQCGGAGLDVYSKEPPTDLPLIQHPKVICTPHLGASTVEAQSRVAEEIAEQFLLLLEGKFVPGIVNSPSFCQSITDDNRAWVSMCQSLGFIIGKFAPEKADDISLCLVLHGQELKGKENVLNVAALTGFLKQRFGKARNVNFINAPVIAKAEGIQLGTACNLPEEEMLHVSLSVTATFNGDTVSHDMVGSVQGNEAFLHAADGSNFEVPAKLSKNAVVCRGKHGQDMTVKLLSSLAKSYIIHSASWSAENCQGYSWCVINGRFDLEEKPEVVAEYVDLWTQLTL